MQMLGCNCQLVVQLEAWLAVTVTLSA